MSARNYRSETEFSYLSSNRASCGAKTYLFFPFEDGTYERTKERLRFDMEEMNEEIRSDFYRDILSDRRTPGEIVTGIKEYRPEYQPNIVSVDTLFEK